MNRRSPLGSRALAALLPFCVLFFLCACGAVPGTEEGDSSRKDAKGASDAEIARAAQGTNTTDTVAERAVEAAFVHRATDENSRGDYTYLDDPSINGDADAAVFATPTSGRAGKEDGAYDHNIGVWYESEAQKWAIFNQDRAPVSGGATFQVVVPQESEEFTHRSTPENISENSTYLDHPLANGKPEAVLSVTQNWNPGGGTGVYNDHPVGIRYDAGRRKWAIFNEDGSAMPGGAAFNVAVSEVVRTMGSDIANLDSDQAPEVAGEAGTKTAGPGETTKDQYGSAGGTNSEEYGGSEQASGDSEGFPEYRDFYSEGDPKTPDKFVTSDSSTGAIPVVKPFNFGRDPGGPEDKTLYLTIPKLGLEDIPAFDTVSEKKLRDGTVHIPATGYPWQEGANVFIAGHRIGYENTPSYYVFFRLDELANGDEILLEDSAGGQYLYRINKQVVVGPNSVGVMNPVGGKSLITLQTCTLPDYEERLIVQGELIKKDLKDD